jgi:periplasmic protein TonB
MNAAASVTMMSPSEFVMPSMVSFRLPQLAWASATQDDRRFQRLLIGLILALLFMAIALPFIPLRKITRTEVLELPAPMAKLLLERKVVPPAPPPPAPKAAEKAAEKTAEPAPLPKEIKPDNKPAPLAKTPPKNAPPVPEARQPVEGKPPGEVSLDNARKRASGVGLLAMKDQLAEITGAPAAVQLRQDIKPGPGVGAGVGVGVGAGTEAGVPLRAMITGNATQGSGGINTSAYSRDTGGGGLAGRATTMVEGVAGGGGGGGPGGGGSIAGKGGNGTGSGGTGKGGAGGTLAKDGSGKSSRSIEEIKLVMERNKGAIYAIYNRALRDEPGLQGKVVIEMKIAPSGQVEGLRLISSELKADELEKKLLARIRQFDFGAKDVNQMTISWPLDFLPS